MKYLKTRNQYKALNFLFEVEGQRSWSYGWWLFSCIYKDRLIFNNTMYSSSTRKHQSKARGLIKGRIGLTLRFTTGNLINSDITLKNEIKGTKLEIKSLIEAIRRKGSRKATNADRREKIQYLLNHIKEVREVLNA